MKGDFKITDSNKYNDSYNEYRIKSKGKYGPLDIPEVGPIAKLRV